MSTIKMVPKVTKPTKITHTTVDTIMVTPEKIMDWKSPPFQRPLKVNAKVLALSEQIKVDGGVIPGVITVGVLNNVKYLLDGQHRREAFILSECKEGYLDVRYRHFDNMADMGEEFVNLNSALSRLTADDILRGLEGTSEALTYLRKKCPFIGYSNIRHGQGSPIVSMSVILRSWYGSASEVPGGSVGSSMSLAKNATMEDAQTLSSFLTLCLEAWGRDDEYKRLWGALNLVICMWLYRRLVITPYSQRIKKLTNDMFRKCLMSLSANVQYLEWLVGRMIRESDRSPCYMKVKNTFAKRIEEEENKKAYLPQPPWAGHPGGRATH